jgi:hypothetical protein
MKEFNVHNLNDTQQVSSDIKLIGHYLAIARKQSMLQNQKEKKQSKK